MTTSTPDHGTQSASTFAELHFWCWPSLANGRASAVGGPQTTDPGWHWEIHWCEAPREPGRCAHRTTN